MNVFRKQTPPDDFRERREAMVELLRRRYRIGDERILEAMRRIPRHRFLPPGYRFEADPYGDHPCPIGHGQTISQPYIVAHMTELLDVRPGDRILEIGSGSGYQAALLLELGAELYTVETVPELADWARHILAESGYRDFHVRLGDGYRGWPEAAPFDGIILTCAPPRVPPELAAQLADGGRMVLPVGVGSQQLVVVRRTGDRLLLRPDIPVRFVPMVPSES